MSYRSSSTARLMGLAAAASSDFLDHFTWHPGGTRETDMWQVLALFGVDDAAGPGRHRYYVRVEQRDGELAWSSPIWIDRRP